MLPHVNNGGKHPQQTERPGVRVIAEPQLRGVSQNETAGGKASPACSGSPKALAGIACARNRCAGVLGGGSSCPAWQLAFLALAALEESWEA